MIHQYIERQTSAVITERLIKDRLIKTIYSDLREKSPFAFRLITSGRMSALIAFIVYDLPPAFFPGGARHYMRKMGISVDELHEASSVKTPRQIFERKIRYWECRPMNNDWNVIVSPADSRVVIGSFTEQSSLFIKNKFFSYEELLGTHKENWRRVFNEGDFALFRLTPEKYHWNHFSVSGIIEDFYEIGGSYHSCNPAAVVEEITPYSKNRRSVCIINTNVENGSRCGYVAMIEVAALMIGGIEQRYSAERYDNPVPLTKGMFIKKGTPKSVFRPGSSVDILIFEKDRVRFAHDIRTNLNRYYVQSRYSMGFGKTLVETDIQVRSEIARSRS